MTSSRGDPAEGREARREALVDRLADHLLAEGLGGASLRQLAAAADTSDRMLLYYFRDKADLLGAALDRVAARFSAGMGALAAPAPLSEPELLTRLVPHVFEMSVWPFLQLWLEMAAAGARGDAVCRAAGGRIGASFLDWIAGQLDLPDTAARQAAAARVLTSIEGLALLKALGLGETCAAAVLAQAEAGRSKA